MFVDERPCDADKAVMKGLDVPAQKTLECLIEREQRRDRPRIGQHHDKPGERPGAVAEAEGPKRAPVHLGLVGGQRGEPAIGRRRDVRTQRAHDAPQLHHRAGIAARAHHLEQARGAQPRILSQRVTDERQIRICQGRAAAATAQRLRVVGNRRTDGVMVDAEGRGVCGELSSVRRNTDGESRRAVRA